MATYERQSLNKIDLIIGLIGLSLLLLMGYFSDETIKNILQAIGTSLIAAGLVTFFTRSLYQQKHKDESGGC